MLAFARASGDGRSPAAAAAPVHTASSARKSTRAKTRRDRSARTCVPGDPVTPRTVIKVNDEHPKAQAPDRGKHHQIRLGEANIPSAIRPDSANPKMTRPVQRIGEQPVACGGRESQINWRLRLQTPQNADP